MSGLGIVAGVGAISLGIASFVGWGSTSKTREISSATVALDGASLFRAKGCSTCHDGPDTHALIDGFPSLVDVPSFAGSRRPGYTADAYVAESVTHPWAFRSPAFRGGVGPTTQMPVLDVSDAEVDALVAYLLHDDSARGGRPD